MRFATVALAAASVIAAASFASAATVHATSASFISQGLQTNGAAVAANRSNPANAIGAPGAAAIGGVNFVSLGIGGSIVLGFAPNQFTGPSTVVFEVTNGADTYPEEKALVAVSFDGLTWTPLAGFATNKAPGSASTLVVPAGPWTQMRITDATDTSLFYNGVGPSNGKPIGDGFDLNAVSVIPVPLPAAAWAGIALLGVGGIIRRRVLTA
jgi:hypothetical protein